MPNVGTSRVTCFPLLHLTYKTLFFFQISSRISFLKHAYTQMTYSIIAPLSYLYAPYLQTQPSLNSGKICVTICHPEL